MGSGKQKENSIFSRYSHIMGGNYLSNNFRPIIHILRSFLIIYSFFLSQFNNSKFAHISTFVSLDNKYYLRTIKIAI